jgi:hypothetical protein
MTKKSLTYTHIFCLSNTAHPQIKINKIRGKKRKDEKLGHI